MHDHDHGHDHDHDHDHAHGHNNAHGHDHPHAHVHSERTRPDFTAGEGAGKLLFLDAASGLAGDMIISALIDLGVPETVVANAVASLPLTGFHLHIGTRTFSGIVATSFDVHVDDPQPERTYGSIRKLLDESTLPEAVKARAQATFRKLALSEAKVHRAPLDDVHFHEVGAVDAIVDVVGSAAALEWIGAEVVVSPLPMGRGFVKARHGVLPLPAPAVVECLAGFDTYDGGLDFEFVTPTGAAIVAAHALRSSRWPRMSPERVGWGAGTKELADRPNLLRAVLGARTSVRAASEDAASNGAYDPPPATHVVLETNIDDATGELVGHAIETLMEAGALDVWATPITMKKGRPGLTLSVLTAEARAHALTTLMLRETTSIGVRRYAVSRTERPRRVTLVRTRFGEIAVKVSEGPFGPPQAKPEFDACRAAAGAHGVPVREVIQEALTAFLALPR